MYIQHHSYIGLVDKKVLRIVKSDEHLSTNHSEGGQMFMNIWLPRWTNVHQNFQGIWLSTWYVALAIRVCI